MPMDLQLQDRDFVIFGALLVVGLYLLVGPGVGTGATDPAEWEGDFRTVSSDASLDTLTPVAQPANYDGPFSYQWFRGGNDGAWQMTGLWTYLPGGRLVLHPWTPTPATVEDTSPSSASQTVTLPDSNRIRAVMSARNPARDLEEDVEGCRDSKAVLRVSPVDGTEQINTTAVVGSDAQTLTLDVSRYAGEEVRLSGMVMPGDAGCGIWSGEFLQVNELYIEAAG